MYKKLGDRCIPGVWNSVGPLHYYTLKRASRVTFRACHITRRGHHFGGQETGNLCRTLLFGGMRLVTGAEQCYLEDRRLVTGAEQCYLEDRRLVRGAEQCYLEE